MARTPTTKIVVDHYKMTKGDLCQRLEIPFDAKTEINITEPNEVSGLMDSQVTITTHRVYTE